MLFPAGKRPAEARWVPCSPRSGGETVLGRGAVSLRIQHRGISTRHLFRPGASSVSERAQRRRVHL